MRAVAFVVALVSVVWTAGCSDDEPKRFRVSGEAKFNGAPIPYGEIHFTPDGAKMNSGPQGIAVIRDGGYDTSAAGGKGIAGGPTVVRVIGLTKEAGTLLCDHEYTVDLPRADTTHNADVPASAAPKKAGTTPEI